MVCVKYSRIECSKSQELLRRPKLFFILPGGSGGVLVRAGDEATRASNGIPHRNHQFGGLQQELKEFQCKFPAGYRVPDLMDDTTDGSMTMTSEAKQSCLALEHPEICASPSQGVGGDVAGQAFCDGYEHFVLMLDRE
ncbi:hypothetical protein PCH_Pc15g00760 [Penicillium rubens Wisconsin 54-1255]|uniref:Uncharacterized protein n=1 Tax=Penicillium rubens (strain ATCC 28089 / DSM 1075 / NRRL 1951 / Wisconsin 54-1255) TaxID=500485 RepID=B6H6M1_PENRW|nr:hypothetical protein PCH_Pc15g00760 [Penicillium rubens Wisconsin 54-1255]